MVFHSLLFPLNTKDLASLLSILPAPLQWSWRGEFETQKVKIVGWDKNSLLGTANKKVDSNKRVYKNGEKSTWRCSLQNPASDLTVLQISNSTNSPLNNTPLPFMAQGSIKWPVASFLLATAKVNPLLARTKSWSNQVPWGTMEHGEYLTAWHTRSCQ